MSNREMNFSNKKKGDGNGNSVINNHEYSNKANTSSISTNEIKDVKGNSYKREK